jgi:dCMP deaminase
MVDKVADDSMCMEIAHIAALRSHDEMFKVGCVIVTPDHQMTIGWNGMPAGMDNDVREPKLLKDEHGRLSLQMKTRPENAHAELNALGKFAGSTASAEGGVLYTTMSPCMRCAILIHRAKIREVVYEHEYKDERPLTFLSERGIGVRKL